MLSDPEFVAERSVYVVLKDWEQEAAIILALWAIAVIGYKAWQTRHERELLSRDLIQVPEGMRILPEDVREYARQLEALPPAEAQRLLLRGRCWCRCSASARHATCRTCRRPPRRSVRSEAERLDSELSMVRYIAWAIPSIGFIGTVRGIGEALGEAHRR